MRGGDLLAQASRGLIIPHFSRTSAKFPVCLNATFAVALCTSSATLGENRTGAFSGPPGSPSQKKKNRQTTHTSGSEINSRDCGKQGGTSKTKTKNKNLKMLLSELHLSRWRLDTGGVHRGAPSRFRRDGLKSSVPFASLHLPRAGGKHREWQSGPGIKPSLSGISFPSIRRCFIRLQASHYIFFFSIIWIHVFFPASTWLRHTFHFIIEFINYRMFWLPFTDLLFVYVKFAGYVVIYWHSNDLCAILAFRTRACNLCWPCVQ